MKFTVDKPLNGHDEDAPAYADDKMLIVCDGLGGGGQNAYLVDGVKRTSAYLGSREISRVCQEYFAAHYEEFCSNMQDPAGLITGLKAHLSEALDYYVSKNGLKNIVRGRSMQMLPSTLAAIIYKHHEDHTDALVISAGDSRAFVLTPEKGLQQISKDDVFDNVDAFEKSATMTNNIRQDGEFHINYGYLCLPPQCILLVCTDGCFDYISTPMELEYRLEYAISKCGDLLDPDKDNLGQYFGNLLVQSGLKDDCTMAGAILGYSDSESTKNLFLRRALQVQEKYRNPCASYDKESAKRKAEVAAQLPELETKTAELQTKIDSTLKTALMTAFQEELEEKPAGVVSETSPLLTALRSFELYQNFLNELKQVDKEIEIKAEAKFNEFQAERDLFREDFKSMRFDEYVNSLKGYNFYNPFNLFKSNNRDANEYKQLQIKANEAANAYTDALSVFSQTFEKLKMLEPKKIKAMDDFKQVSIKYQELHQALTAFVESRQALHCWRESLRTSFMQNKDLDQEFIDAWKQRFSGYPGNTRSKYSRCVTIKTEYESCVKLTREQKIERFKTALEANLPMYLEYVKNNSATCQMVCGTAPAELSEMKQQYEDLKKYGSECDTKKYDLWLEYKPTYELFVRSLGGTV